MIIIIIIITPTPNLVAESDDVTLWQVWNAWRSCCSQWRQVVQPFNLEQGSFLVRCRKRLVCIRRRAKRRWIY